LIKPFPTLFLTGNVANYLAQTVGVFAPIYLVVALILFASQGRHGESWRALMEKISRWIPLLGPARRALSLSRLAAALEALINAGVPDHRSMGIGRRGQRLAGSATCSAGLEAASRGGHDSGRSAQ